MKKIKKKFIIIDGNALVHRSFHALPTTMQLKDGRVINAVYGFTSVLIKALREFKPEYIVVTFDMKGPTFRHEQFEAYKAHREKAPDELYAQIPMVKEIVSSFNIPIFEQAGFEADDLIGTLSRQLDGAVEKIIVTGDMDTLQLVNDHTKVYTMSRGMSDSFLYGPDEVRSRYGLTPEQIVDYKALRGDASDNIPGVKGIGEKTAVDLLSRFSTLEKVYENIDSPDIKDRIRKLLKEYKNDAFMSQVLATIKCDVEIDFDLSQAVARSYDKQRVMDVFERYEFRTLLPRAMALFGAMPADNVSVETKPIDKFERNRLAYDYRLIDDDKKFNEFLNELKKQKSFTFDTETSGFDPLGSRLRGISFSWREGLAYYLSFDDPGDNERQTNLNDGGLFTYKDENERKNKKKLFRSHWLIRLAPFFSDEKIRKNAHNGKFDLRVLAANGIMTRGFSFDTMLASYVLDPGGRQHGLDALVLSQLGFEKISKDDLLGKGRDKSDFATVALEKLYLYSCEDADFCERLRIKLQDKLQQAGLEGVMKDIEIPLIPVLVAMEDCGIQLDSVFLSQMEREMQKEIISLEKKIFVLAGAAFNIRSTQQLAQILFDSLALSKEGIKKNKKGFSTSVDELQKLKDEHEIIPLIMEYRELTKLQSTYIEALPKLVNKKTGRLHTSFNQTIAATGRLSSTDPNLQNIPIRTELGRRIRQAFVAAPGFKLLAIDYSQIELRLAAHMSGDETMIKAFNDGDDIHTITASLINGVPIDKVSDKLRREAKAVNFGILYGQGPHGLSQGADIPFNQAKEFIDNYFKVYKGVRDYLDETIEVARKKGYVETMFGRKRFLPEINANNPMQRKAAERMAANTPLQGSAADIIKLAMIQIAEKIVSADVRMLLQVHDELVFEIRQGMEKEAVAKIKKIMENVIKLSVPLIVDVKIGDNWGEMEKINL